MLHALLHMAEFDGPATSETLAQAMQTNPVVVRRLMGGLRDAGLVDSAKGHGGGWVISCPLDRITLADIHQALGAPRVFAMGHRDDHPSCLVEQAVNGALGDAFDEAEALLLRRFESVTLADLSADFHRRLVDVKNPRKAISHDA